MGKHRQPAGWQCVGSAGAVNLGATGAVPSLSHAEAIAGQQGLAGSGVDVASETQPCQHNRST